MKKLLFLLLILAAPFAAKAQAQIHGKVFSVANGGSLTGVISTVTDTLTNVQVDSSASTPATLVAAITGKTIIPCAVTATVMSTGHTAFGGGSSPYLIWGNTNKDELIVLNATYITQSANYTQCSQTLSTPGANDATTSTQGVPIKFWTSAANFTGGAGTTLIVTVSYYIQ